MAITGHFLGRTEVRWGIIGCGDVTEVKSGPGFQKAAGSRLVAVMRRRGDLAADYARRHQVPRWYDDAAALIADPEVDAVYIATLPNTHAAYALQVAAAGKPAYVEKPMARTATECDRMVDEFTRAELPLFVAYYRRRLPRFLAVEEILQGGRLGSLTGITYRLAAPHHLAAAGWRLEAEIRRRRAFSRRRLPRSRSPRFLVWALAAGRRPRRQSGLLLAGRGYGEPFLFDAERRARGHGLQFLERGEGRLPSAHGDAGRSDAFGFRQ